MGEQYFEAALVAVGPEYRAVRSKILGLEVEEAAFLKDKLRHGAWVVRLQVEIFIGWRADPDRYAYIHQVARGTEPALERWKYRSGRPPVEKSTEIIAGLGPGYLPAVLEVLYKEPDLLDDHTISVCTQAVLVWGDRRAIPVFQAILQNQMFPWPHRARAIEALLGLEADYRYEDLLGVFNDEKNPLELRYSALASLHTADRNRAIPLFKEVLVDPKREIRLRQAAAWGLGGARDTAAIELLMEQFAAITHWDLKFDIITALGNMKDPKAAIALRQLQDLELDRGLAELMERTLEDLEKIE